MECPHLISDCKINCEYVKIKKNQLIDKCNSTTTTTKTTTTKIATNNNSNKTTTGVTSSASSTITNNNQNVDDGGATTVLEDTIKSSNTTGSLINVTTAVNSSSTNEQGSSTTIVSGNDSQPITIITLWKCGVGECDSKNNWMCLNCGEVLCGRYEKAHAMKHYNTVDHKVCMSIHDYSVYCYKCDNFVINTTPALDEIRHYLLNEDNVKLKTSSNIEESVSLSGSSIKSSSNNSNASVSSNDSGWEEPLHIDTGRRLRPRKRTNSNESSAENKGRKVQRKSTKDNDGNNANNSSSTSSTTGTSTQNRNFRRFVGLRNLGNTCFMNSVLQSLSNIQEFSGYISSLPSLEKEGTTGNTSSSSSSNNNSVTKNKQRVYHSSNNSTKENYDDAMILRDLRRLLIDLSTGNNGKPIPPEYLLHWNFPQFNMNEQNDAHEFLRYMLDRLHTELQHLPNHLELNNSITTTTDSTGSTNTNSKLNSTKEHSNNNSNNGCANGTSNNTNNSTTSSEENNVNCNNSNNSGIYNCKNSKSSIVTNVFGGILQNEVRCLICGMESRKHDPFLDLSLDIPKKFCKDFSGTTSTSSNDDNSKNSNETNTICNIKDCIASFMEAEELGVGELYYCSTCECKRKSIKRFWIRRLPNVLCLHIKRFRWSPRGFPYNWSKIDLKISFPLKALDMSQYVLNSCPETRRNSQINNIYDLGAVIVHHGKVANFGHYTSYAVNNDTWLHFNDHSVKEVSSTEVADCKPYMLFYIRRDPIININNNSPLSSPSSTSIRSASPTLKNHQKISETSKISDLIANTSDNLSENKLTTVATTASNNSTL